MPPRNDNLNRANIQDPTAWAAGACALYAAFPALGSVGNVPPSRVDYNKAVALVAAAPDDYQGLTYQSLFSGGSIPAPGSLVNTSQLTVLFFGWAERVPTVRLRPTYRPYHTDRGGPEPHDHFYGGASALVSCVMTVWNEAVYALMGSYTGDFYRGQEVAGDVGRWMGAEGCAFQLFLTFPYFTKDPYTDGPPGYRFVNAWLHDDGFTPGSSAKKLQLAWKCQRLYNPADGSYTLYDCNTNPLAGVQATIQVN